MTEAGLGNVLMTGESRDPKLLTSSNWHQRIWGAIRNLTLEDLQGLVSYKSILRQSRNGARCIWGSNFSLDAISLLRFDGAKLLFVTAIKPLPGWTEWPLSSVEEQQFALAEESFLVLKIGNDARCCQFIQFNVTWQREVEEEGGTETMSPINERSLTATEVFCEEGVQIKELFQSLDSETAAELGCEILCSLAKVQRQTSDALARCAEKAARQAALLEEDVCRAQGI